MGVVYEATDERLNRNVAIKILPATLTENPERRARFQQEAQLAAAFNHSNIATVYDVGEDDGVHFMVMELVRGESLRDLVGTGPVPIERAVDIATGIAAGLARAHREGVIHRDLKPDNVMLADEGQPKILDFGLGKLVQDVQLPEPAKSNDSPTATIDIAELSAGSPYVTRAGQMIGTLSYMSPEQLQGGHVDERADVFAFGVVLYEMLAGGRPFGGDSTIQTMTAILRDDPEPLETVRPEVPEALRSIVTRCLAKDAAERFASGQELLAALEQLTKQPTAPAKQSKPAVRLVAGLVVVALLAAIGWFGWQTQRTNRARNEMLPEIERLTDAHDWDGAMRLIREASAIIPDDPQLAQLQATALFPVTITSDPPGARVLMRGYANTDREWIDLGTTPLTDLFVANPHRIRIELDGYEPFEAGMFGLNLNVTLHQAGTVPEGMVHVDGGAVRFYSAGPVEVDPFWIDRYEVTQAQYKAFVDDGGYERRELWHEDTPWDQVSELFVDSTGLPGPASWELGTYPSGTENHPVHGVSWFEADAFARWSGKSLPTVFHWSRAANQGIWSDIVVASNFDGDGPAPIGSYDGLGRYGTYDMAGNVSEWCLNEMGDGGRYLLGGSWADPIYIYKEFEAAEPLNRSNIHGIRLIQHETEPSAESVAPVVYPIFDFREAEPIGDEAFEIIRGMYAYDKTPLEPQLESTEDTNEHWRLEVVSIRAAYGDERIPVHIYLPRNAKPPYQTVIYSPGSDAIWMKDSSYQRMTFSAFVPRSGRALVYPVYKGTYERAMQIGGENDIRDRLIFFTKDLRRTIDYLETRDDLDTDKLGYLSLSWGSTYAPVYTAIEDRFNAAVLLVGGLYRYPPERPPEALPINYTPHVQVPLLMINTNNDFGIPVDNAEAMLEKFGTAPEDKKLTIIEGGHVPESPNVLIREALDWFDRYLGEIER